MNGQDIISLLTGAMPAFGSVIGAISGSIITAVFMRSNTNVSEFEKIKAGQFKEVLNDLLNKGQLTYTELYKANNFLNIAKKADSLYKPTEEIVDSKKYDFDWFIRFFEAAGNISDEEIQNFWAQLLAGEVGNPGKYSLRIIDILRNLRKKDAELFVEVCKHIIHLDDNEFLPNYEEYMEHHEIIFSDIMRLSELGLIFENGMLVLQKEITNNDPFQAVSGEYVLNVSNPSEVKKHFMINQFPLTIAGKELSELINCKSEDSDFFEFSRMIKSRYPDLNTEVFKVIYRSEDVVKFDTNDLL